jgi:hypothetical protein
MISFFGSTRWLGFPISTRISPGCQSTVGTTQVYWSEYELLVLHAHDHQSLLLMLVTVQRSKTSMIVWYVGVP